MPHLSTRRLVLAALAVTVFTIAFNMLTCGWLFRWVYELPPTEIWRDVRTMPAGFWGLVDIGTLLVSIIYVIIYARIGCCIGTTAVRRGLSFGFCLWMVSLLPGMFFTYAFMEIAAGAVTYFLLRGIVEFLIAGLLIAWLYPLPQESCSSR